MRRSLAFTILLLVTAFLIPAFGQSAGDSPGVGREKVQLNFLTRVRTWGEILEGMNKILRANNSFITRITMQEMDHSAARRLWADSTPEQRSRMLVYGLENPVDENTAGLHPLFKDKPLPAGLMPVLSGGPLGCSGYGTWDPKIMSLRDVAGKKVDMDRPPTPPIREDILKALGVLDKTQITFLGSGSRTVEALKNQNVDVDIIHLTGATRPIPSHIRVLSEDKIFIVDSTREGIEEAVKARPDVFKAAYPYPLYQGDLKKALGLSYEPVREPVVYCIGGQNPHILAGAEVDEEIIYELVSVILKNKDEFRKYVTGDVDSLIKGLPLVIRPQSEFHPGARRAFEEMGVNYGVDAMVEVEDARAKAHGQEFYVPEYMKQQLKSAQK